MAGRISVAVMLGTFALFATTTSSLACACGCGVFDIGNVFTDQPGGNVYAEYDYMDQNKNWKGASQAPAADNDDKNIRTSFYTLGGQYLFESGFGIGVEVPVWARHFVTDDSGTPESFDHSALGDIRITGAYSGFFENRGTGVTLGIKLPTGDFSYPGFDRVSAIGSGSTDLAFGAYHRGTLDAFGTWRYFLQGRYETAVTEQGGYRPGGEFDAAAAISYDAGTWGGINIAPMLQFVSSARRHDSGIHADPENTGYTRLLLAPGLDFGFRNLVWHAEIALPVYQNVTGNQLVAPVLFKTSIAYLFF